MPNKTSISIIGAGNVAHHLAHRLVACGYKINQIFSRKITKARRLAKPIGASAINDLGKLSLGVKLIIIAVHDDAIGTVAQKINHPTSKTLVVHTSGSVPSKILKPYFKNYGCLYPLQSFSISIKADFETIPFCIYSPQKRNRILLNKIAESICPNVYEIDDHQRAVLHIAATMVNNFSNQLYHMAYQITTNEGVNFDILKPLILKTAQKIQHESPDSVQTGPAIRGDKATMMKHLSYLKKNPDWSKIYELLSKGIQKQKSKK